MNVHQWAGCTWSGPSKGCWEEEKMLKSRSNTWEHQGIWIHWSWPLEQASSIYYLFPSLTCKDQTEIKLCLEGKSVSGSPKRWRQRNRSEKSKTQISFKQRNKMKKKNRLSVHENCYFRLRCSLISNKASGKREWFYKKNILNSNGKEKTWSK